MIKNLFLWCLCTVGSFVYGQNITAFVDTNEILIGEQITLNIVVNSPIDKVSWTQFEDTICKGVDVITKSKIDTSSNENGWVYSQQYTVTSFDSGYYIIKPIQLLFKDSSTLTDPILITVNNPKVDVTQDIMPIGGNLDTPFIFSELYDTLMWIGIVIGTLMVLAIIGILIWKRYRDRKKVLPEEEKEDITVWLRAEIDKLEEEKLWQKGNLKEYQSKVSFILRVMLQELYHFPCKEETSGVILAKLEFTDLSNEQINEIERTLNFADLVKYAKATGIQHQHEEALKILEKYYSKIESKIKAIKDFKKIGQ